MAEKMQRTKSSPNILKKHTMQNKAQMLLDEVMAVYVQNELDRAGIQYTLETRVLDNGDLITCLTYDGCDPYVGNYIFHAGATFFKETFQNLQKIRIK